MENGKIIKNIERLGERYCQKYLNDENCNKQNLEKNWWEALKFFFSRSFMRGRKDKLSNEYYCFTVEVLKEAFGINENFNESYKILKKHEQYFGKQRVLNFKQREGIGRENVLNNRHKKGFKKEVAKNNRIVELLIEPRKIWIEWKDEEYEKEVSLGNDEDVMMVLDVLKFISDDGRKNIYSYIKNVMTESGVEAAYNELIDIRGIGPKIASLIIRDIGLLDGNIVNKHFERAFPVDTWVKQIAQKLIPNDITNPDIQRYFIDECLTSKANPLKVAAGLWFMGSNSLDILINDCLPVVDFN